MTRLRMCNYKTTVQAGALEQREGASPTNVAKEQQAQREEASPAEAPRRSGEAHRHKDKSKGASQPKPHEGAARFRGTRTRGRKRRS